MWMWMGGHGVVETRLSQLSERAIHSDPDPDAQLDEPCAARGIREINTGTEGD